MVVAAASAMEDPVRPPIITLVTMLTWPNPPRRWPTSEVASLIRRSVIPVIFMIPPDKMKKGIARRIKESNAEVRLCGTMSIIRSPCGDIARMVLNVKTNPIGIPSKIRVSMEIKSIGDDCIPARYPLLRYPIIR